jgi:hypothetical protein
MVDASGNSLTPAQNGSQISGGPSNGAYPLNGGTGNLPGANSWNVQGQLNVTPTPVGPPTQVPVAPIATQGTTGGRLIRAVSGSAQLSPDDQVVLLNGNQPGTIILPSSSGLANPMVSATGQSIILKNVSRYPQNIAAGQNNLYQGVNTLAPGQRVDVQSFGATWYQL